MKVHLIRCLLFFYLSGISHVGFTVHLCSGKPVVLSTKKQAAGCSACTQKKHKDCCQSKSLYVHLDQDQEPNHICSYKVNRPYANLYNDQDICLKSLFLDVFYVKFTDYLGLPPKTVSQFLSWIQVYTI